MAFFLGATLFLVFWFGCGILSVRIEGWIFGKVSDRNTASGMVAWGTLTLLIVLVNAIILMPLKIARVSLQWAPRMWLALLALAGHEKSQNKKSPT